MSSPDNTSERRSMAPAAEDATIRQTSDALAAAVEISRVPSEQSESAPRVAGYVLKQLLGEGAYGQVWRGVQVRTRKEVAIKAFIQRTGLDWIFLQREVERLAKLDRHPHIVTLLDTDLESEPPVYVMDLIEGGSLHQFVNPDKPASPQRALRWFEQICEALTYVHGKGLIHCDLKPANILLDEQENVRVVDFGQSRVFTDSAASLGTLYYMAPEQAKLTEPGKPAHPDVRWDIYALGATIYAILTGRPPRASESGSRTLQEAENLTQRLERYRKIVDDATVDVSAAKGVDRELLAIIAKCLAPKPEDRYESVAMVATDLAALRADRPVSPLAKSRGYRIKKFVQRNPFRIGLVVATLILIPSLYIARQEQAKAGMAQGRDLAAMYSYELREAHSQATGSPGYVQENLRNTVAEWLVSKAAPLRAMSARSGPVVNPDAFWAAVDGGTLWDQGEWLEVVESAWPDGAGLLSMLAERARTGTDRQKYVAYCLIGQLAGEGGKLAGGGATLADQCAAAATTESSPGVAAAARWAAGRLGKPVEFKTGNSILVDDVSGLTFARLPANAAYRRGQSIGDDEAFPDERPADEAVSIGRIYVSTTETTLSAVEPFVNSVACDQAIVEKNVDGVPVRQVIRNLLNKLPIDDKSNTAAAYFSLGAAREYCRWLTAKAAEKSPKRTYRLPTEAEWEYACRGGHETRFCYGTDVRYARHFATCDGSLAPVHTVARKMPNWFGLFDMHGGLWEWCDSRYEEEFAAQAGHAGRELYVWHSGGYYGPAIRCRATQRNFGTVDAVDQYLGFRVVVELSE